MQKSLCDDLTCLRLCSLAIALMVLGAGAVEPTLRAVMAPHADTSTQTRVTGVSILVYHRVMPAVTNEMTIRPATLHWQLDYLKEHHYPIVPLRSVVAYLLGTAPPPPPSSVVITIDDGHRSVYTDMLPVLRKWGAPVTLFIYPSAISNASYALTWQQIAELQRTGLFTIESHTYWHPNFKVEHRRLAPDSYREFATRQLCRSRSVLEQRVGAAPSLLAWPFGVYEDEAIAIARRCGYTAAFTLGARGVTPGMDLMTLPRFLVTDKAVGKAFAAILPPAPR
jgi:peptidoglycan/xylan/chitin deacetylase (PgdA/CDA1 family)